MTKAAPWVKFFSSDFLTGVADLEADEIGIYTVVLALIWDRGAPVPDDSAWLARRAGTSTRRFNAVRKRLIAMGKLEARNGMLGNRRAIAAVEDRDKKSDQARNAALARWHGHSEPELPLEQTGEKREIKSRKTPEQNVSKSRKSDQKPQETANAPMRTDVSLSRTRATLEDSEDRDSRSTTALTHISRDAAPPPLDPLALTDHLARLAGVRLIEPGRIIENQQLVKEWLALGVDLPAMETAIAQCRPKAGSPIKSLRYFDPAIRQEHARKELPDARPSNNPDDVADPILRRYLQNGGTVASRH